MYEFQCLRDVFDLIHGKNNNDETEIKTTEDLDNLYSRMKIPEGEK